MDGVLVLVGSGAGFVTEAEGAARSLGLTDIRRVSSLNEANCLELPAESILALDEPSPEELMAATDAIDKLLLPRWSVVARAAESGVEARAEIISTPEWTMGLLARIFRLCMGQHLLFRENAQFRGDLLSLGTRVAHDMRTPLGGIVVSCEAVNEQLAAGGSGDGGLTMPILESEEDVLRIVKRMAVFTRAFATRLSPESINAADPLFAALDRLGAQMVRRKATVTRADEWPEITADPKMIEIVWLELVDNAIKHGGDAPRIELGWSHSGNWTRFTVGDGGAGVPAEKLSLLFYPFHRLHEPNAARGLGLPIAERLVRLHGGRCGYESLSPGRGLFYFELPLRLIPNR